MLGDQHKGGDGSDIVTRTEADSTAAAERAEERAAATGEELEVAGEEEADTAAAEMGEEAAVVEEKVEKVADTADLASMEA